MDEAVETWVSSKTCSDPVVIGGALKGGEPSMSKNSLYEDLSSMCLKIYSGRTSGDKISRISRIWNKVTVFSWRETIGVSRISLSYVQWFVNDKSETRYTQCANWLCRNNYLKAARRQEYRHHEQVKELITTFCDDDTVGVKIHHADRTNTDAQLSPYEVLWSERLDND